MKRSKPFLILTAGLLIMVSCSRKKNAADHESIDKPNILFIMSDDHAYQAISAYSDKLIRTPNID